LKSRGRYDRPSFPASGGSSLGYSGIHPNRSGGSGVQWREISSLSRDGRETQINAKYETPDERRD
jgi:hypothetical protein